jgi:DNA (cytosine-5)-methyltransferase 1
MIDSMNNGYSVGSLFAGIGGICIAFKQSGCEIVWANEWDKNACITYRNNSDTELYEGDIHEVNEPLHFGSVDILTSGFPCQAFSIAGYRKGFSDEKGRGNLFFETARFIDVLKPKAFLLENVKNLVGHDKGNTFKVIKNTIVNDLNYSFIPFVLNSKDFGNIPQTRERIYIVGFKNESEYVFNVNEQPHTSLFTAMNNIEKNCTLNFKIPNRVNLEKTIHDVIESEKQDEKYYYKSSHQYFDKLSEVMNNRDTVYQWRRVYVRENKSNVCPTLTANMGTGGHNVPLIIDNFGIRKLIPKECLNFQGFPKDFNFPENMANSHCYKQAGNSVVVPVVKRIADEIIRVLDLKYKKQTLKNDTIICNAKAVQLTSGIVYKIKVK